MILPEPPDRYDQKAQRVAKSIIEQSDLENQKRGRDIEVAPARIILTSPNGTRYYITVTNAGVLGTTAA